MKRIAAPTFIKTGANTTKLRYNPPAMKINGPAAAANAAITTTTAFNGPGIALIPCTTDVNTLMNGVNPVAIISPMEIINPSNAD